jgi:hypothetical protein
MLVKRKAIVEGSEAVGAYDIADSEEKGERGGFLGGATKYSWHAQRVMKREWLNACGGKGEG